MVILTDEEIQKIKDGIKLLDSFNRIGKIFKYVIYIAVGMKLMSVFIFEDISTFFKSVMAKIF